MTANVLKQDPNTWKVQKTEHLKVQKLQIMGLCPNE